MVRIVAIIILFIVFTSSSLTQPDPHSLETELWKIIKAMEKYWNEGDLEKYM